MKTTILAAAAAFFAAVSVSAQETPLWLRKNAISPDGKTIAFTYKGDIYTVPTAGGLAKQITSNPAYDTDPLWTPDGKSIVFSSEREGSRDIFITSRDGGTPKRITNYPGKETPKAVLADGSIIFTAALQADAGYGAFPGGTQVYSVKDIDSRPQLFSSINMQELSINKDGIVIYEDYKGKPLNLKERFEVVSNLIGDLSHNNKLNLIVHDGEQMYIHTNLKDSLYYLEGESSILVSTKALDFKDWKEVPINTVFSFINGELLFESKPHSNEYVETEEQIRFIEKFIESLKTDSDEEYAW